ncbi:hypothetical protein C0Q70_18803 [Pomacea canaliculata]|uniref:SAM domain-containing protein n=1 Tax=Pomacea canaliculata TaxID=400727 RepID=A0A2T7NHL4_POMCA|nr:uncharacterized protein LOC112576728 [Pomacea canaliculata]PVD20645.1 hypothetical protein C0Q70_18803 [Pomacea canaliculata]
MSDALRDFLAAIGLEHHFNMFLTRGFDEESDIAHLTVDDLRTIGIENSSDIHCILKAAQAYKTSKTHQLFHWLRKNGLLHYYEGFVQSRLTDLNKVASLSLPEDKIYDELEITLPGHQRRFERAVKVLRRRLKQKKESNRVVVTEGWWGFPAYLPKAKYPFLCVQATIRSTSPLISLSRNMEFMVDSGSDVSTLRDDIIQELKLEVIRQVTSCGVFGSQRTNMYRANLTIGDQTLEIEVISSSYDSVGSCILRYFGHEIDAFRHIWYRGQDGSLQPTSHSSSTKGTEPETISVLSEPEAKKVASPYDTRNKKKASPYDMSNKKKASTSRNNSVNENSEEMLGENRIGDDPHELRDMGYRAVPAIDCGSYSQQRTNGMLAVPSCVALGTEINGVEEWMKHENDISENHSHINSK